METSVVSYLVARDSKDFITLGRQKSTRQWWNSERSRHELFVSDVVLNEAGRGDSKYSALRLAALGAIPVLATNDESMNLAAQLVKYNAVSKKAADDAAHIAVAAVHSMRFLLTWNFRHIHQAYTQRLIESVCLGEGFACPVMCSPEEFMGRVSDD